MGNNSYKSEESRIKQGKKVSCDVIAMETAADPSRTGTRVKQVLPWDEM